MIKLYMQEGRQTVWIFDLPRIFIRVLPAEMPKYHTMCCSLSVRSCAALCKISHGMCEYFTRYTAFAKYLCSLGYIVCGNDHLGHGSSVPPSGTLGFFGHHHGWSVLIDDVAKLTDKMKKRWPNLPYFLLGHSMGSMVARLYLSPLRAKD